jgi:hypothetical protein
MPGLDESIRGSEPGSSSADDSDLHPFEYTERRSRQAGPWETSGIRVASTRECPWARLCAAM